MTASMPYGRSDGSCRNSTPLALPVACMASSTRGCLSRTLRATDLQSQRCMDLVSDIRDQLVPRRAVPKVAEFLDRVDAGDKFLRPMSASSAGFFGTDPLAMSASVEKAATAAVFATWADTPPVEATRDGVARSRMVGAPPLRARAHGVPTRLTVNLPPAGGRPGGWGGGRGPNRRELRIGAPNQRMLDRTGDRPLGSHVPACPQGRFASGPAEARCQGSGPPDAFARKHSRRDERIRGGLELTHCSDFRRRT